MKSLSRDPIVLGMAILVDPQIFDKENPFVFGISPVACHFCGTKF